LVDPGAVVFPGEVVGGDVGGVLEKTTDAEDPNPYPTKVMVEDDELKEAELNVNN